MVLSIHARGTLDWRQSLDQPLAHILCKLAGRLLVSSLRLTVTADHVDMRVHSQIVKRILILAVFVSDHRKLHRVGQLRGTEVHICLVLQSSSSLLARL